MRGREECAPSLGFQILTISPSVWEILAKLYVGGLLEDWRPLEGWRSRLGEILDPPLNTFVLIACNVFNYVKCLQAFRQQLGLLEC